MGAPTPEEVNQMKRFMAIASGEKPPPLPPASSNSPQTQEIFTPAYGPTSEDVSAAKDVLERFYAAIGGKNNTTNVVSALKERAREFPDLHQALITEKTDNGVKVGSWEITKHSRKSLTGKDETYYNVHNVLTEQQIKANFLVPESAQAVVKILNSGFSTNHPKIREIAQLEISYRHLRERALEEKIQLMRSRQKNRQFKIDLYEAKFEASRAKALFVRERIKNIFHTL